MTVAARIKFEVREATESAEELLREVEGRDLSEAERTNAMQAALRLKAEANRLEGLVKQLQAEMCDA